MRVVDRDKAEMLGVPVRNVFATLQTYLAGTYVNNINLLGHTFQVIAMADAPLSPGCGVGRHAEDALDVRRDGAAELGGDVRAGRRRRTKCFATTSIRRPTSRAKRAPGAFHRAGDGGDGAHRARAAAVGLHFEWTDIAYQQQLAGNAGG